MVSSLTHQISQQRFSLQQTKSKNIELKSQVDRIKQNTHEDEIQLRQLKFDASHHEGVKNQLIKQRDLNESQIVQLKETIKKDNEASDYQFN